MHRYLVERTFTGPFTLPSPNQDARARQVFIENNAIDEVTWIYSYVARDEGKAYCVVDAPTPEAVRRASQRNNLPVDRITEVCMLVPYLCLTLDNDREDHEGQTSDARREAQPKY